MLDLLIVLAVATLVFFFWQFIKIKLLHRKHDSRGILKDYALGINYLLNEQEDKALEIFIKVLEVDKYTIETHLTLGSLFRKRGEVDRAIRIHQNLIARPQLTYSQRLDALLALGDDYLYAGVLDRAERVFLDIVQTNSSHTKEALYALLDIYQQEKSWRKAIQIAKKIEANYKENLSTVILHHYCELVDEKLQKKDVSTAFRYLKSAMSLDKKSVRANLLDARIYIELGKYKKALKVYDKIIDANVEFLPEIVHEILQCYEKISNREDGINYITSLLNTNSQAMVLLLFTEGIIFDNYNIDRAIAELKGNPSILGLAVILKALSNHNQNVSVTEDMLGNLSSIANQLAINTLRYLCSNCGFYSKNLIWYCPGCKKWDSISLDGV